MRRSSTPCTTSRGIDCDDMKLFVLLGTEACDEKARLYEEVLPWNSSGLLCGELYKAMINMPNENMSAAGVTLPSITKSGDV